MKSFANPSDLPILLLLLQLLLFSFSLANVYKNPEPRDACHPNPCQNGGSCTVVVTLDGEEASCECVGGNAGKDDFCNRAPSTLPATDPCEPNPCEADGRCFPDRYHEFSGLDFKCMCDTDRTGDRCEIETGRPKDAFTFFP